MPGHYPRRFGLLPALGACSCVTAEVGTATPPDQLIAATAPALIEQLEREPLTIPEALIRSGRESLAAGHYRAALQSLQMAAEQQPEAADELRLDIIDAALGLGALTTAEQLIATARRESGYSATLERQLQSRIVLARELANARGFAPCEAEIFGDARPLIHAEDSFAAWNAVRSGLPAGHAIPIPTSEAQARAVLCDGGCASGEPILARLEGDNEATVALVIPDGEGFLVMPDLLHPITTSCGDDTLFAVERHGELVRVRAIGEQRDQVSVDDWHLVELPVYAASPVSASSPSYAYASSGYASSGYASSGYASSGYHGSSGYQYGSSGYYGHYGCGGGYDYDYDDSTTCEIAALVERDVILDIERGEIVLDIVRSGSRGSELGRVRMTAAPTGPVVDVEACGVRETLKLSYS